VSSGKYNVARQAGKLRGHQCDGSCTRVTKLTFVTTFGNDTTVPVADDQSHTGRFRLFGISVAGSSHVHPGLLIPPSSRGVAEGEPLEEVLLLREGASALVDDATLP
jgi:hypothetical protein